VGNTVTDGVEQRVNITIALLHEQTLTHAHTYTHTHTHTQTTQGRTVIAVATTRYSTDDAVLPIDHCRSIRLDLR